MKHQKTSKKNKILVIAAHPDDEVLGCGGSILRHSDNGDEVSVVFLSDGESSRDNEIDRNKIRKREHQAHEVASILGIKELIFLNLPDNKLDSMQLLEIVKLIENIINKLNPSLIYTHHGGDLNIDHRIAHQSVVTASRPLPNRTLKKILCFETLSSSDWATQSIGPKFSPNYYVNIEKQLEKKLSALKVYKNELRDFPHPRSLKSVKSLSHYRGSTVGLKAAEAFDLIREIVT